jgi:TfoX/Sxy family transcriptional regulator of competence genes
MPYDEALAERVRTTLDDVHPGGEIAEKKMFGGVAFLLAGNMAVGIQKDALMVRLHPDDAEDALEQPAVRPFDMGRGPSKGWVLVDPPGVADDADLRRWVERGRAYALSLPAK